MHAARLKYLLFAAFALVPNFATACLGTVDEVNDRAIVGSDCSYHYVGESDLLFGGAAQDIGNGLVIQRMAVVSACTNIEDLLVFDCNAGEAIMVRGGSYVDECWRQWEADGRPGDGCGFVAGYTQTRLEYVLAPNGPLDIVPGDSLREIQAKAEAASVAASTVQEFILGEAWWDRYDMRCGCQLFYPDSAGANE